jgi:hypothetical protein
MEGEIALKYRSSLFKGKFQAEKIMAQEDGYYKWPSQTEFWGDVLETGIVTG